MKALVVLLLLAFYSVSCNKIMAQSPDSRTYFYLGAGIEKDFSKKLSAGLDLEGRFCNSRHSQDVLITPSVEYSPIKFLSAGLEYRATVSHRKDHDSELSGRFGAMLKAKVSPYFLNLSARIKYCNYTEDYEDGENLQYFRTKFELGAKIKALKLSPYVSYEWFYNLSRSVVDKDRYTVGIKKKLDKHNSLAFEYMLEEKFNRGKDKLDINKHVFALSYQYSIPAPKKKKNDDKENKNSKEDKQKENN